MKILINISLMTIQVYSSSLISCLFEYAYDGRNCISRLYALVICNPDWSYCQNILASKEGAISAESVLMETKRFVEFYEMGIANHGTGFYRFTSIDSEAQKQACINFFGSPAAAYYEVYKEGGSENKKKRMIKVDKSRKESLTVI